AGCGASAVAAGARGGEKDGRTVETLLHLPIRDRQLFYAKVLAAFIPALAVSWIGFCCFAVVANGVAWPVMHRIFIPTGLWLVVIGWGAPAVAALGIGGVVRVRARAQTAQEASQLGGAVILPLIFLAVGQSTGLLLVTLPIAVAIGGAIWAIALWLIIRGGTRFARDRVAVGL